MPNNTIEKRLWAAADELRANSRLRPSEYYLPVLRLIFLRYADHKFAVAHDQIQSERAAIFDILTRPGPDLSETEKREVKRGARELLVALKTEKLVLDWRKRQQTRAAVRVAVKDAILQLPERFTDNMCQQKSALVYQHIHDNYQTAQRNTYAMAA